MPNIGKSEAAPAVFLAVGRNHGHPCVYTGQNNPIPGAPDMAIQFNSDALARFRNVNFRNGDTIANLDGKGLKANGELGNFIGKMFRATKTQDRNNAVRTELLRSLGQAFGLAGLMKEEGDRVAFSPDFMQKLEKLLGRDILKTGDFKIDRNGFVKSGKPLTQRRIQAIVSKALRSGGEFDVKGYETKLAKIQSEIKSDSAQKYYKEVKRALDFYKNEIGRVMIKNPDYEPAPAEEPDLFFDDDRKAYELKHSPYLMWDYEHDEYVPLKRGTDLREHLNNSSIPGNPLKMFIHLENAFTRMFDTSINNDRDFDLLQKYLKNTVRNFVELSVDCYFAAKENGKMQAFEGYLFSHDPCMDGRTTELMEFAQENLPMVDVAPSGDDDAALMPEAAKPKAAPVKTAGHTMNTRLDDCIYKEIQLARDANPKATGWKDLSEAVKANLVGLDRPIAVLNEKTGALEPLKENGETVVRKVTAEDVDRIGPACCDILAIF
jgi:hypothetical protein